MATLAEDQARSTSRLKIIDADTHLSEPYDLWTRNAPTKFRDRVPQVKMHDGQLCWVIDGDKSIGDGARANSAILRDGSKPAGLEFEKWQIADVHPGSSQVGPRLAYMDDHNILAQILYPNILGFGGQKAAQVDPELRLACVRLYNDAMAEIQEESGQRLFGMAMLPWWDVGLSVEETVRCARMGLRGININSDPQNHEGLDGNRLGDLGTDYWNPLWEACVDHKMPVNFHIGASETSTDWFGDQGWPSLSYEMHAAMGGTMMFFNNGRTLANIIYSGVCDRYPDVQFVSVESGIGWIPFLLESLDYQYRDIVSDGCKKLQRKPSEYFETNFHACFWFERDNIAGQLRRVGTKRVLFETDFPHPTCLYPIDDIDAALDGLTQDEKADVLCNNAAELYRIAV